MALAAKVPSVLAGGDYKRKTINLGYKIPYEKLETHTYEEIMQEIQDFYIEYDITPKIPENWNPQIY